MVQQSARSASSFKRQLPGETCPPPVTNENAAFSKEAPAMRKPATTMKPGPVALYLSELAEGSKRTMRRSLIHACAFLGGSDPDAFPWHKVKVGQVAALRADLASRYAPNTANKVLAAVRGVLKAAWRMGLLSAEDLYRCGDVRPVKGGPAQRGRCLTRDELKALFLACGDGPGGKRDAAV